MQFFSKILEQLAKIKLFNNKAALINDPKIFEDFNANVSFNKNENHSETYIYNGLTVKDTVAIVDMRIDEKIRCFSEKFSPQLQEKFIDLLKKDVDFSILYQDAIRISARKNSEEVDELLIKTLEDRIRENESSTSAICNEAVSTIEKLSLKHLKILHDLSLMHNTSITILEDWKLKDFEEHLKETFSTFFEDEIFNADLGFLAYTGCISDVSPSEYNFMEVMKKYHLPIDNEELINSETFIKMKNKFENSMMKNCKLTIVGEYIGLKYNEVINKQIFENLNTIFRH